MYISKGRVVTKQGREVIEVVAHSNNLDSTCLRCTFYPGCKITPCSSVFYLEYKVKDKLRQICK